MSNKEFKCEPFLDDDLINFHNLFTLMDPGFNTSEIKPIMLSIPKSLRSKSKLSPKTPTSPRETPEKGRLLTATTLKTPTKSDNVDRTSMLNTPTRESIPNKEISPSKESAPSKEIPPSKENDQSSKHIILDPVIQRFVEADQLFWLHPVPVKRVGCFHVLIDRTKSNLTFQLFFDKNKPCIMSATFDDKSIVNTLNVSINGSEEYIVNSSYDTSTDTYFVSLSENGNNPTEICAANFVKPHIFDFYIPALKKNKQTGTSFMFPVPYDPSQSALFNKFKEKSNESIRLQSRLNDDPNMDTSFSGRFINKLPSNFILYHQSNKAKDIISFGQADESGYYLLNISYPLSTIQGFIAAITSHLSY